MIRWVSLAMAGPNGHYDDIGDDGGRCSSMAPAGRAPLIS